VIALLDPGPEDTILDVGCGDGPLTLAIASKLAPSGYIIGLDSSSKMIASADAAGLQGRVHNAAFHRVDCRHMTQQTGRLKSELAPGRFNKVFSNAAMHWILRAEETRISFFDDVFSILETGGSFVFEMGGRGNVSEVQAALTAVLHHGYNISSEAVQAANPWFFPSDTWMRQALEEAGFDVDVCELVGRPTKLTEGDGKGTGLAGWVRLMCAQFLELVPEADREGVVEKVVDSLKEVCIDTGDGSQWLGYVRLRALARKPARSDEAR